MEFDDFGISSQTIHLQFRMTNIWNGNDLEGMTMPDPCCFSINNPEDIWGQSWNLWLFQFFFNKKGLFESNFESQLDRPSIMQVNSATEVRTKKMYYSCSAMALRKLKLFFSKKSCRSSSQTFESSRWSERKTCLDSNFYH